jgi:hypothetical protein
MARPSNKTEAEKTAAAEAKRAKFKEIAAKRLDKAVDAIDALRKLSTYKPSEAQRDYIIAELSKAAQGVHAAYSGQKATAATSAIPD